MDEIDWPDMVRQHGPLVWKTAYRLVKNAEDANDCYQEAFSDAVSQSRRKVVTNWPGLLVHIVTRRAIDLIRQRESQRRRIQASAAHARRDATDNDPSERAIESELVEQLREQLAVMPEQHALVFSLRYFNEWSDNEIADELGMKPGNIRVLLHRIRSQLRERMAGTANETNTRIIQ